MNSTSVPNTGYVTGNSGELSSLETVDHADILWRKTSNKAAQKAFWSAIFYWVVAFLIASLSMIICFQAYDIHRTNEVLKSSQEVGK